MKRHVLTTHTVCKHCWLIHYETDMGPELSTAAADQNFAWICKQHQDRIGLVLIFRTKITWSGPEFVLVRCGYLNAANGCYHSTHKKKWVCFTDEKFILHVTILHFRGISNYSVLGQSPKIHEWKQNCHYENHKDKNSPNVSDSGDNETVRLKGSIDYY